MRTALTAVLVLTSTVFAPGPVDLAEILAAPPSPDYVHAASSDSVLNGAFTPHQYAQWLANSASDVAGIERTLTGEGLKRGYARSWVAPSSTKAIGYRNRNWLIETVEEYASGSGAQARYAGVVSFTKGPDDGFVHQIETSIPNSYGALIFGSFDYFVMFVKGNDVYIVRMESDFDDMTAQVLDQAKQQYAIAPVDTIPPAQWISPAPAPSSTGGLDGTEINAIVKGFFLGVILLGRAVLFAVHLRRRRPA